MKYYFLLFKQILFSPTLLLFYLSNNKKDILLDVFINDEIPKSKIKQYSSLLKKITSSAYFRTLFYHRTPRKITTFYRLFYPKERTLIIDINCKIGGGVHLAHPYSTILNAEVIGKNLYLNHLVTVGEIKGKKPIIGNNVELHANCIVIGGIIIGHNVIIGAGAVVNKNVPDNSVVIGNPMRIIDKK